MFNHLFKAKLVDHIMVASSIKSNGRGDGNRDQFKNKFEYFLTALSYAVGLGNVWR